MATMINPIAIPHALHRKKSKLAITIDIPIVTNMLAILSEITENFSNTEDTSIKRNAMKMSIGKYIILFFIVSFSHR